MGATEQRRLAAIMFTDMVGYSALAQHDDKLALELLEEHRRLLREIFPRFNGSEIKTIGDAFLAEFSSALEAAQCGIEIQRALAKRNHDVTPERRIELKIGIHIGDVVHRDGDVYGDGVNIASRIEPLAGAGGICVSMDVERQIRNALEARFEKLGAADLKNIKLPMELFRIVLPWERTQAAQNGSGAKSSRMPTQLLAGVGILLALAVGWWFWKGRSSSSGDQLGAVPQTPPVVAKPVPVTPAVDAQSIAVLAFANLSDEKGNEYFSDGISEELLNILAKVPGLKVSARTSAFSFKGRNVPIPEIAKQLGVAYVVEGSVRKAGERVRITAQLIKAADGFHVWSDNFDREVKDVFAVQDEIAALIAKNLQLKMTPVGSGAPTENPEAYRLYLEGRQEWNRRTLAGFQQAEVLLNRAIDLDPKFARAHAALADVWGIQGTLVGTIGSLATKNSPETQRARAKAEQALMLDPRCAEAYAALGSVQMNTFQFDAAAASLRKALELNPNYASGHQWLGRVLGVQGYLEESIGALQRAAELDPLSHRILDNWSSALERVGRISEAWTVLERARALNPNGIQIRCMQVHLLLRRGQKEEALAAARTLAADRDPSQSDYRSATAIEAYMASGLVKEAEELLNGIPPRSPFRAMALVSFDRKQEVIADLDNSMLGMLEPVLFGSRFVAVRSEPGFQTWLDRSGLRESFNRGQAWLKAHPEAVVR